MRWRTSALLLLALAAGACADEPDPVGSDTDPTKPVIFSLRNEYFNLPNGAWINSAILRVDRLVLKDVGLPGRAKGSILRLDLPFNTVHQGNQTQSGLGDIYGQALLVPQPRRGFTVAYGSGLVTPTATHVAQGGGKWKIAPAIIPVQILKGRMGFAFLKFQDWVSFAGHEDRPDQHYMTITPTFLRRLSKRAYFMLDSESSTDWYNNDKTNYKSGFLLGWMLTSRMGIWVKTEIPWGPNRTGDWTLKGSLFRTRF